MAKPRVAILTSLVDFSPAYSLVGIILDQARMLKRNGYPYDILCLKSFNHKEYNSPEIEKELSVKFNLPQTRLVDYPANKPPMEDGEEWQGEVYPHGFEKQVTAHFEGVPAKDIPGYKQVLKDYDVIITHDLMFLSWHLPQNKAVREAIDIYPDKTWLHWVHSGPSSAPDDLCYPSDLRYSMAPHSTYVYLNETQRLDYSLMIGATKRDVRTVYNPKDIRDVFNFSKDSCRFIDHYDLFDHEILQVYPFSTPRWVEKGVKQLLKIFSFWKRQKVRARLVLINAHCNNDVDVPKVEGIENYAKSCGLRLDDDVIMTSRYSDVIEKDIESFKNRKWRYTVPYNVVQDLLFMSNMFVFPSVSECCSLIQAEASISGGKYMVLNRDFAPMMEFCDSGVLTYEFTKNNPDSNEIFYECVAKEIWANFKNESSIINTTKARNTFYNRDWIFKEQFEPLLYLGFGQRAKNPMKKTKIWPKEPDMREIPLKIITNNADTVNPKTGELEPLESEQSNVDYENPYDGMECKIFGVCDPDRRAECNREAGHCFCLDEGVGA